MLIVLVAPEHINNKSNVGETAETTVRHSIAKVQEIDEPQVSKQEEVEKVAPTPVQETPPTTQEAPKQTGCEAYRAEVSKYNWNVNIAMAVMKAESGCRNTAVGDTRVIGGIYAPSCGLFQVRTLKGRPSCEQLKDPATNIAWAYKLQQGGGWRHWSVFNNGQYLRHM